MTCYMAKVEKKQLRSTFEITFMKNKLQKYFY